MILNFLVLCSWNYKKKTEAQSFFFNLQIWLITFFAVVIKQSLGWNL
jgi:hypothetical protein